MPALPLTDQRWSGLPLLVCDMDPGLYRLDVCKHSLIVRDDEGMDVEVLSREGGRCVFRQAPMRFDLYTPGLLLYATSDRPATKSFVVELPPEWLPVDYSRAEGRMELHPRFQFGDPLCSAWCGACARTTSAASHWGTLTPRQSLVSWSKGSPAMLVCTT